MTKSYNIGDIINFLAEKTLAKEIQPQSDLVEDLGVDGDDFTELMLAYSKSFSVDLSSFLWYFHHAEEGVNLGAFIWKSPDQTVQRIPVTPTMLLEFANKGSWTLEYPIHVLPQERNDLLFNVLLIVVSIAFFALVLLLLFFV